MTDLPKVLLVEMRKDYYSSDPVILDLLNEFSSAIFDIEPHTWTDALMMTLPKEFAAAFLDCGRLSDYELDVIRKIQMEHEIPIFLHASEDRADVIKAAMEAGVTEFIKKPQSLSLVVEKIKEHIIS